MDPTSLQVLGQVEIDKGADVMIPAKKKAVFVKPSPSKEASKKKPSKPSCDDLYALDDKWAQ